MNIIVEDGTIVAGSNSYVTVEEMDQFVADIGGDADWDALSETQKSTQVGQGARWLNDKYKLEFVGSLTSLTQSLPFPRVGYTNSGRVLDGTIPDDLKNAQCEVALVWSRDNEILYPDNSGSIKSSYSKVDVITENIEYIAGSVLSYTAIDNELSDLVDLHNGGFYAI